MNVRFSFNRNTKKFILLALLAVCLGVINFFVNQNVVHAATGKGWAIDLRFDGSLIKYDINNSGSYGSPTGALQNLVVDGDVSATIPYQYYTNTSSNFGIGTHYVFFPNYLYQIDWYLCFNGATSPSSNFDVSIGTLSETVANDHSHAKFRYTTSSALNSYPVNDNFQNLSCRVYNQFVVPTVRSTYVGINFSNASSAVADANIWIYGVEISNGGLYASNSNDDLKQAIDNTQSSINSNINSMEEAVTSEIDDMEEAVTSEIDDSFNQCDLNIVKNLSYDSSKMGFVNNTGGITEQTSGTLSYTDYIDIHNNKFSQLTVNWNGSSYGWNFCLYDQEKVKISCSYVSSGVNSLNITVPDNAYYYRTSVSRLSTSYTVSGIGCENRLDQQTNAINDLNDTMKDSNVSGANSDATSFFNNFQNNDFGLSDVITMPLSLITSLTSATCTDLTLPLPFVNNNLVLPCMYPIYQNYFGSFLSIYQTITFGIVSYWVCINLFRMVKNFKNPDNDEVEVMEL